MAEVIVPISQTKPRRGAATAAMAKQETQLAPETKKHQGKGESEDDESYAVAQILDKRGTGTGVEYKIRWEGYGSDEDTWEPEANVADSAELIAEFNQRHTGPPTIKRPLEQPSKPQAEDRDDEWCPSESALKKARSAAKTPSAKQTKGSRTLALPSGGLLNLDQPLPEPITSEMAEALRQRILELEAAASTHAGTPNTQPVARVRQLGSAATSTGPPAAAVPLPAAPASTSRTPQVKKLFQKLKVELKGAKFYKGYDRRSVEVKVDDSMTNEEFHAVFDGYGVLVQPTPNNKPGSKVHIQEFRDSAAVLGFFGSEFKADQLKGAVWRKGGQPTGGYGGFGFFGGFGRGGGGFSKAQKLGTDAVSVRSMKLTYSAAQLKLTMKFDCINGTDGGGYGYDDCDSDW